MCGFKELCSLFEPLYNLPKPHLLPCPPEDGNDHKALSLCKVENVKLLYPEPAQNLGDGKWLITASNPHFKMRIDAYEGQAETEQLAGCQACIVRLPCGGKLVTNFTSVQADSASFKNKTVLKMDVKMPGPLRYLINSLPPIGELHHQPNIETAETSLIEEVQNRMARSPTMTPEFTNENIEEIARPIIQSYRELRKPLKENFGGTLQTHLSFSMTITSFIVAQLCQVVFHYAKPYLPCMYATRIGMFTQEEMSRMSYRKKKYQRIMLYETPERNIHAITNKPHDGFQRLSFETGPHPAAGIGIIEARNKGQQIEDSPFLQIAEAKAYIKRQQKSVVNEKSES